VSEHLRITQVTADFLSIESCVFTFEEGLWNIRGRYDIACKDDEELIWSNDDGEYVTHILVVSLSLVLFFFYIYNVRT
jgi:hypothetical protein